jgi:putative nucleotidyltransferase with HDIG domain
MNTTVDDCEVVQAIIHPVTVYVMNMLIAEKTSTNFQFHQVSVNADSTFTAGDMHVNVSSVVIDTENFPIDGDVVCYLDLAVIRNINSFTHGNHPQKADVGVKYEITPHRFLEVTIGDVFTHTKHVCDAAAEIADRVGLTGEDRAVLLFTALCHDMGKPFTTVFEREAWRSPGHDSAGVPIARQFLESIGCLERIIVRVLPLIAEHMFPVWTSINRRTVRRLKLRLEPSTVDELLRLMEADASGRPPLPKGLPNGAQRLIELNQDLPPKIEPVVTGRHIMDLGITDGKTIGAIKRRVFEAQIEEVFDASDLSAAINFTRNLINTEYAHAAAWRTYPVKIQTKD